jgi:hypothetical protein
MFDNLTLVNVNWSLPLLPFFFAYTPLKLYTAAVATDGAIRAPIVLALTHTLYLL